MFIYIKTSKATLSFEFQNQKDIKLEYVKVYVIDSQKMSIINTHY